MPPMQLQTPCAPACMHPRPIMLHPSPIHLGPWSPGLKLLPNGIPAGITVFLPSDAAVTELLTEGLPAGLKVSPPAACLLLPACCFLVVLRMLLPAGCQLPVAAFSTAAAAADCYCRCCC